MPYTRVLAAIFIMAAVTYLTRMIPLVFLKRKIENRFLRSFLQYVPYAAVLGQKQVLAATAAIVHLLPEKRRRIGRQNKRHAARPQGAGRLTSVQSGNDGAASLWGAVRHQHLSIDK